MSHDETIEKHKLLFFNVKPSHGDSRSVRADCTEGDFSVKIDRHPPEAYHRLEEMHHTAKEEEQENERRRRELW